MTILATLANYNENVPKVPDEVVACVVECAILAYQSRKEVEDKLDSLKWYESDEFLADTQAFVLGNEDSDNIVVAFRGTQEPADFLTDAYAPPDTLKCVPSAASKSYEVHAGFQRALDGIWNEESEQGLGYFLSRYKGRIWLTGHSLGGALATIAAARLTLGKSASKCWLVTIGSPRVFTKAAAMELQSVIRKERILRIRRASDLVPALPYRPYKHVSGDVAFVTRKGDFVRETKPGYKMLELFVAVLSAMEHLVATSVVPGSQSRAAVVVAGHSSHDYLKAIRAGQKKPAHRWMLLLTVAGRLWKLGLPAGIASLAIPVTLSEKSAQVETWLNERDFTWPLEVYIAVVGFFAVWLVLYVGFWQSWIRSTFRWVKKGIRALASRQPATKRS